MFPVGRFFKTKHYMRMGAYSMASPQWVMNRDRPRFFDQVGHQISIFSLNNDLVSLTKIMNNLVKDLKILSFNVISKRLKLVESFQKNFL